MGLKQKVIAVVGPTAVGKSNIAIELAKLFNGEIISGDSMQIYQGMDIGTAKVTESEKQGIAHHLIDILPPEASFSVADFKERVQVLIKSIEGRGHLPIIAGGTGLYIDALMRDYALTEEKRSEAFVSELEEEIKVNGIHSVFNRLKDVDPVQASKIHPSNVRRVIRALEIYERTGLTMSAHQEKQRAEGPYDMYVIGLNMERSKLYARIDARVDKMIESGLIEEAKHFYDAGLGHAQSMRGIGYKEWIPYFEGVVSKEEAIDQIKLHSRRYAKRQLTWFRNKMPVQWYEVDHFQENTLLKKIIEDLAGFLNAT